MGWPNGLAIGRWACLTGAITAADVPPVRLHDLRHTHATVLPQLSVPVHVISQRLGHASPMVTMTVYAHALPGSFISTMLAPLPFIHGNGLSMPPDAVPPRSALTSTLTRRVCRSPQISNPSGPRSLTPVPSGAAGVAAPSGHSCIPARSGPTRGCGKRPNAYPE